MEQRREHIHVIPLEGLDVAFQELLLLLV